MAQMIFLYAMESLSGKEKPQLLDWEQTVEHFKCRIMKKCFFSEIYSQKFWNDFFGVLTADNSFLISSACVKMASQNRKVMVFSLLEDTHLNGLELNLVLLPTAEKIKQVNSACELCCRENVNFNITQC